MSKRYPNLAKRLKRLLFEKDIKPIDLARAIDLPAPTIHRLVTGKSKRPYITSLQPIADFFSIDMEQLVGEKPLSTETEEIELTNNQKDETTLILSEKKTKTIPILSWKSIFKIIPMQILELGEITVGGHISNEAFALIMPDHSMEPLFSYNSMLIFDPTLPCKDRSYVLAHIEKTGDSVFRQFIDDENHKYLKPLNPDTKNFQMRLVNKEDKLIATLVESRNCF